MGCLLRTARTMIVSSLRARPARCQLNEPEDAYRWSPVVTCMAAVPPGVCSLGSGIVAPENAFMKGRQAAEAVVIARKLRRVCFELGVIVLVLMNSRWKVTVFLPLAPAIPHSMPDVMAPAETELCGPALPELTHARESAAAHCCLQDEPGDKRPLTSGRIHQL